jgi:hypothetical protein
MHRYIAAALLVVLLGTGSPTTASSGTVKDMLAYCDISQPINDFEENKFCSGYIIGAIDTLGSMNVKENLILPAPLCYPEGITYKKMTEAVWAYLKNKPHTYDTDAAVIIYAALLFEFFCD